MGQPKVCRRCGACCALGHETVLVMPDEPVPEQYLEKFHMKTVLGRCVALRGKVGEQTQCAIYKHRPDICRRFIAAGQVCRRARVQHGLED